TSAAGPSATPRPSKARGKKDLLYDRCCEEPFGHVFQLEDLENYGVGDTKEEALALADQLVNAHLFVLMKAADNEAMWKHRPRDQAQRIASLSTSERLVYARVEEAGNDGIWLRTLNSRVNVHSSIITKCLKDLKTKHLIKEVKSAKSPARKMYMLFDLEPSEENLGGAFFADGELDIGLVEAISGFVVDWVEKKSWAEVPGPTSHGQPSKKRRRIEDPQTVTAAASITADAPKYKQPLSHARRPLIPRPPNYSDYPTSISILELIRNSPILSKSSAARFTHKDVEQLLDMLIYDNRLERMGPDQYRSVRRSFEEPYNGRWPDWEMQREQGVSNGVADTPCGQCPVFDLCEPGGVYSPEKCVYFDDW
ncbi:RNA polymerase Rpc34, partial [Rhizodiscina lignyota]